MQVHKTNFQVQPFKFQSPDQTFHVLIFNVNPNYMQCAYCHKHKKHVHVSEEELTKKAQCDMGHVVHKR